MHDFERQIRDADAGVAAAERRTQFATARLTELLPDLNEATALELRVQSASGALARARERQSRTAQLRQAYERRPNNPGLAAAVSEDETTKETISTCEREFEAATGELTAVRNRIESRESELRTRFGLS